MGTVPGAKSQTPCVLLIQIFESLPPLRYSGDHSSKRMEAYLTRCPAAQSQEVEIEPVTLVPGPSYLFTACSKSCLTKLTHSIRLLAFIYRLFKLCLLSA